MMFGALNSELVDLPTFMMERASNAQQVGLWTASDSLLVFTDACFEIGVVGLS